MSKQFAHGFCSICHWKPTEMSLAECAWIRGISDWPHFTLIKRGGKGPLTGNLLSVKMEIIIISVAAFLIAILTFFSGFGLGTILTPVFMIFFPVDLAIALTGVVHFFNNIFKLFLVGKKADKRVVLRFGIPAVIAAFAGAWLLLQITDLSPPFLL